MRTLVAASLFIFSSSALADRPVYKSVGADGKVTYSDRKADAGASPVKNWTPAYLDWPAYQSAVLRAESDRHYYARLQAERRQPVPVVVYDPRAGNSQPGRYAGYADYRDQGYGYPRRGGWDPYLPASPPPGLERNYYYNGR